MGQTRLEAAWQYAKEETSRESHCLYCGDLGGGSVTFVACTSGKCGNAGSRIKVLGLLALAWCLESLAVECGADQGDINKGKEER